MNFKALTIFAVLSIFLSFSLKAQQNHSLFLVHDITQSNLLNPAVPISCKWYVGIPVLSSVHLNYANSSFTYNQLFTKSSSGTFNPNIEEVNRLSHYRNYIGTEFHTQLFALGYKYKDYSFLFTITEKDNLPVTYPKDIIQLFYEGNQPFIGDEVSLKGTGVYFSHYREYGFGVSKKIDDGFFVGVRAKMLFGKLNISTRSAKVNLLTDETTYDLNFHGNVLIHSSLPIIVDASNNSLNSIAYNDNISPVELALNRKNPGVAFDAGIIYPYSDNIQLSASIKDLGFIRWRSNLNTFDADLDFVYSGVVSNTISTGGFFQNLGQAFQDSLNFTVYPEKYTTFLPPRATAAINYTLNRYFSGGLVGNVIVHRSKTLPSLTFSTLFKPTASIGIIASYTIQNYGLNNLGFGFYAGKRPVQFYIVSDNVLSVIKPLDTRMTNLRFGININLGCLEKTKDKASTNRNSSPCFGMDNPHEKKYLKNFEPWDKRKKK